ncbi:hypothetical protein Hbut_0871 [Hyperthermus butylicus DSM 5456]|uniref:Uncharacterized protein n=1 Tax=Hyperthermus butylicus (strain DSM 5456 / JCM 9403 / PLM1-5) TaxID=415426 RepID=A2BL61_HYPBU|nr:hypothetical protein Hbut_0871 [Hyperthermus butylicus DSM 5456]
MSGLGGLGVILWRRTSREAGELPDAALVLKAKCASGPCILVAFGLGGENILAIVPPQPSPFCLLARKELQYIIRRILSDLGVYGAENLSACIVSGWLARGPLRDVLEALKSYEIVVDYSIDGGSSDFIVPVETQ